MYRVLQEMNSLGFNASKAKIYYGNQWHRVENIIAAWVLIQNADIRDLNDISFKGANPSSIWAEDDLGRRERLFAGLDMSATLITYPVLCEKIERDFNKILTKSCYHEFIPMIKQFLLQRAGADIPQSYISSMKEAEFNIESLEPMPSYMEDFAVKNSRTGCSLRINKENRLEMLTPQNEVQYVSYEQIFSLPEKRRTPDDNFIKLHEFVKAWNETCS